MNPRFTCLLLLALWLVAAPATQAQDLLNPSRVLWTAPLSASTTKTLVDATGNTWALSAPNTFQLFDPQGKVRWTKTLSTLTIADFAVDAQGQVLLVGLPGNGAPVLEKYDTSQTLAWSNRLDSLSGATAQASNISVTVNPIGSGIVLGTNALTDRKLNYYFFTAAGQLSAPISLTGEKAAPVSAIRPVVVNTNDLLFGINQPRLLGATPTLYRLALSDRAATVLPAETLTNGTLFALNETPGIVVPPSEQRILPLVSDGQTPLAVLNASRDTVNTQTGASGRKTGYALFVPFRTLAYPTYINPREYGTSDVQVLGEATGRLLTKQGNLYTINVVKSNAAGTTANLVLNQYALTEDGNKRVLLMSSVKAGTSVSSPAAGSTNSGQTALSILTYTADGSLLIAGNTSGTVTVGASTFAGTPASPTQFLVAIGPNLPAQTLSENQVGWTASLPATIRRVVSNNQQRSWVQLPDSTFRCYDATGKLIWERRLATQGIYDVGADSQGNLYVMGADSINTFDSTGTFRWRLLHKKGPSPYNRKLYVAPSGGGLASSITNYFNGYQRFVSFNGAGKEAEAVPSLSWNGATHVTYSLANIVPLSSRQLVLFCLADREPGRGPSYTFPFDYYGDNAPLTNSKVMSRSYRVPDMYSYDKPQNPVGTAGYYVWAKPAANAIYLLERQNYSLPSMGMDFVYGYSITRFDSTGNRVFDEVNTPRVNTIALAKARTVNPQGTLFTLNTSPRAETAATTSYDLVLSEYAPSLNLRNTTRLGSVTLASGQTDNTTWELVQAYADGSLLLSGTTSGTLTIGANTYTGTAAQPARFLTLLNTTLAQLSGPTTAVCQGTTAALKARYKGYLTQPPLVQLSDAKGSFAQPTLSQSVPLSQSALVDTTLTTLSLPIPASLAVGTYQVRTLVGGLVGAQTSLSVIATPATPTVSQQGDELVSAATTGSFQWYDAQRSPLAGAIAARFRPQTAGTYSVVNTVGGCASLPSAAAVYIITGLEPAVQILVYPNPTAGGVWVYWPGAGQQARIRLTDLQGRLLQEVARKGDLTQLTTQGLTPGLVLVQLVAEGQATQVYKVLLQ